MSRLPAVTGRMLIDRTRYGVVMDGSITKSGADEVIVRFIRKKDAEAGLLEKYGSLLLAKQKYGLTVRRLA